MKNKKDLDIIEKIRNQIQIFQKTKEKSTLILKIQSSDANNNLSIIEPPSYEETISTEQNDVQNIVHLSDLQIREIITKTYRENPTFSPQKIQSILRSKHNTRVTQVQIRSLISQCII